MHIFLAIIVVAVMVVMTFAFEKPKPNPCATVCTANYEPICGGIPNSQEKPKSFGNSCVLDNYNCEHNTKLVMLSKGECVGGGSVRLQ